MLQTVLKSLLEWECLVKVIFLLGLVHKDNSRAKHVHQQLMCTFATVEIPLGNATCGHTASAEACEEEDLREQVGF